MRSSAIEGTRKSTSMSILVAAFLMLVPALACSDSPGPPHEKEEARTSSPGPASPGRRAHDDGPASEKNPKEKDGDHSEHGGGHEDHKERKVLSLTPTQINRLSIEVQDVSRLRRRGTTIVVPSTALVRVLDTYELYTLQPDGTVHVHVVRPVWLSKRRARLHAPQLRPSMRVITKNAGLARVAFLNAEDPGEGHAH